MGHRVGDLAGTLLLTGGCNDGDAFQRDGSGREREVELSGLAGRHGDRANGSGVADQAHLDAVRPQRQAFNAVTPFLIRLRPQHRALDHHLRAGHSLLGRLVRHPPGERALLGGAPRRSAAEQRYPSYDTDQLSNKWNVHRSILIRREVCTPTTPSPPTGLGQRNASDRLPPTSMPGEQCGETISLSERGVAHDSPP